MKLKTVEQISMLFMAMTDTLSLEFWQLYPINIHSLFFHIVVLNLVLWNGLFFGLNLLLWIQKKVRPQQRA